MMFSKERPVVSLREGIKSLIDESIASQLQAARAEIAGHVDERLKQIQQSQAAGQQMKGEMKIYTDQQLAAFRKDVEKMVSDKLIGQAGLQQNLAKSYTDQHLATLLKETEKLIDERLADQTSRQQHFSKSYADQKIADLRPDVEKIVNEKLAAQKGMQQTLKYYTDQLAALRQDTEKMINDKLAGQGNLQNSLKSYTDKQLAAFRNDIEKMIAERMAGQGAMQSYTDQHLADLRASIEGMFNEDMTKHTEELQRMRGDIDRLMQERLRQLQPSKKTHAEMAQKIKSENKAYTDQQLKAAEGHAEDIINERFKDIITAQQQKALAEQMRADILAHVEKRLSQLPISSATTEEMQTLFLKEVKMLEDRLRDEIKGMEDRIRPIDERVENLFAAIEDTKAQEILKHPVIIE